MAEEVKVPELEKAEIPWVVAYLTKTLSVCSRSYALFLFVLSFISFGESFRYREDIQDLRNEVREVRRSVQRLDEKVDGGLARLDAKIDARTDGLDAKIEGLRREMNVQFRWMVATMVAVGGLVVAALKLLP